MAGASGAVAAALIGEDGGCWQLAGECVVSVVASVIVRVEAANEGLAVGHSRSVHSCTCVCCTCASLARDGGE